MGTGTGLIPHWAGQQTISSFHHHAHTFLLPRCRKKHSDTLQDTLVDRLEIPDACIVDCKVVASERGRKTYRDCARNGVSMEIYEASTHPFIVKIWLEETAEEAGRAVWRGHITHVLSGQRRYLKDLDDILVFIAPYLETMGVDLGPFWRIRRWFKQGRLSRTEGD